MYLSSQVKRMSCGISAETIRPFNLAKVCHIAWRPTQQRRLGERQPADQKIGLQAVQLEDVIDDRTEETHTDLLPRRARSTSTATGISDTTTISAMIGSR